MKFNLALLLTAFFVLSAWAQNEESILVENGIRVPASAAINRSVARLRLANGTTCSASFLSSTVLITAGHCTAGFRAQGAQVQVRDQRGVWHGVAVKSLNPHPLYHLETTCSGGNRVKYDLGIVKLSRRFPFAVRPLTIASAKTFEGKNSPVTVAGYGYERRGGSAGTLRTGVMMATYTQIAGFFGRKGLYMLPTKADQVVCPGDSGGAVLQGTAGSLQLIGVNGLSSGCKGEYAFSSSEAPFQQMKWIETFLK